MTAVPDGTIRRQVYGLFAGGADLADVVEQTGLAQQQVADLLSIISYQRSRAAAACRDYDAVHGPPPARPAARLDVNALRAAIRAELAPLAADLRKAVTAVTANRPAAVAPAAQDSTEILATLRALATSVDELGLTPTPSSPAEPGRSAEILTAVRAVQEAVQTLSTPALAEYPAAAPDGRVACYDRYWCPACGSRYVDDDGHECGPLVPVTVTITVSPRIGG